MSVRESTFSSVASTNHVDRNTLAKVTRRLIPFLFACYVLNFVDRTNVGFAKLHLQNSLARLEQSDEISHERLAETQGVIESGAKMWC